MREVLIPMDTVYPLLWKLLHATVYLVGGAAATLFVNWAFKRFHGFTDQLRRDRGSTAERVEFAKQSATISTTARRSVLLLIWIMAVILALRELNFDVGPLLAGAGVAGLAIGFAAQSLLKDVLNGLFLLAEGNIRINDVVRIDNLSGTVEELTLRTTVLRGVDGAIHVFSNGSINNFSNLTRTYAFHVIELPISLDDDADLAMTVIRDVASTLTRDAEIGPLILEPVEIFGVEKFTEQGVTVRARIKTLPSQQWKVGREFNRRLKTACESQGITIATAQRQVSYTPVDPNRQAEIKLIVEEVLNERNGRPATP